MNYSLGNSLFRNSMNFLEHNNREFEHLKTDIYEDENAYYLKIEVPGIDKNNIEIAYENGYLNVTVRQDSTYEEAKDYIRRERMTSEMQRAFYIGDIKEETIKAKQENGLLTICLEKREEPTETKKHIPIE